MKSYKYLSLLFVVLAAAVFTACTDDDELDLSVINPVSATRFAQAVENKGWRHVESHEVKSNGGVEKRGYWNGMCGASPVQYSFEGGKVTTYMYVDAYPLSGYTSQDYTYVEDGNRVMSGDDEVFRVVSVSDNELRIMKYQATRADGKRIYIYSVYRAMTAEELESVKKHYTVNIGTMDIDYPELPEQAQVSEADFTTYAVGQTWKCAEAHELMWANRYAAADFFDGDKRLAPIDYEITSDAVCEITTNASTGETKRDEYTYTFRANGYYVELGNGTTFRIISLTPDEMRILQQRRNTPDGSPVTLYCVYKRHEAETLLTQTGQ